MKELSEVRKAKNVLLFIGDGMDTDMITPARLIAHQSNNGRYLSKMAMDEFPVASLDRRLLRVHNSDRFN